MLFKSVVGQHELKQQLRQTVQEGRIAHAQLFWGAGGYGPLPLALALAQYINCTNRSDDDACGVCPSCHKIQKLIHPDLHFAVPVNSTKEVPEAKKPITDHFFPRWRETLLANPYLNEQEWYETIGIENKQGHIGVNEASRIMEKLHFKSFEADYKMMVIWLPERMNVQAANRLLKLIEEPPTKTLFLLVSEDTTRIIKTILSRTQLVHVPPIDEAVLVAVKTAQDGLPEAQARKLARAAAGSYSRLLALTAIHDDTQEHFAHFVALMRLAYTVDGIALMAWAEELAQTGREHQKAFLLYAAQMLRESFMNNRRVPEVTHLLHDEEAFAGKFAPFVNERNIEAIYQAFNLAIAHLAQNGNAKIIFTDLAMRLAIQIKA
ncbi:MAG: DNA polymerase III subunit delta [Prevotellaceae bacterium]|jgi:DNA polymerase-3 subunit delta'|nr:DNA polymerase III subunit delta [Prevotellaceae bacterium]